MYIPDGKKLKELRKGKKLTHRGLAEIVKASATWVAMLEKETLTRGDMKRINRVCDALGVEYEKIATERKYKPPQAKVKLKVMHRVRVPNYNTGKVEIIEADEPLKKQQIKYHINQGAIVPESVKVMTSKCVQKLNPKNKLQDWLNVGWT